MEADVLTLELPDAPAPAGNAAPVALELPPLVARAPLSAAHRSLRSVAIRHASDHRIVALIELVSPGNKSSRRDLRLFVQKAVGALSRGQHLLVIDPFPPTRRDPQGVHGAIWAEFSDEAYAAPPGRPLTLVSYEAAADVQAFIEPTAVGLPLRDMPLFVEPGVYVGIPLEETYMDAFRRLPEFYRDILTTPGAE